MYPDEEQHNKWHQDPGNWIWGVFYFNRDDRRMMLPKRIPAFGLTLNFANPRTYLLIAGVIVVVALLARY